MDSDTIIIRRDGIALTAAGCYRALAARDARFDGIFFTGVTTTGIYCRPVCGVKTPRASSCRFFGTAAAAEAAGFRPCLRCRPELAPYALQQNLAHAVWQRIAAGALNDGDAERLAREVGLSSRQLRRVLLQHFGVTPVELAQTQRLLFAKKLLQETRLSMSEVAYAAGFGSIRRFNALFLSRYRMAPTAVRRAAPGLHGLPDGRDIVLRLAYRPPFDWASMLRYMVSGAIPGVEAIDMGNEGDEPAYARSVRLGETSGWMRVTQRAAKHQLELSLSASLAPVLMPLLARARLQFDLDAHPDVIAAHLSADPLLARHVRRMLGWRVPGAFDAFELAVLAVLGQRRGMPAAARLAAELVRRFGEPTAKPLPGVTHHFPLPARLAQAGIADITAIGVPPARATAIRELAALALRGGLDLRPGLGLQDAVARLRTVQGIGDDTAQYVALRAWRFPDAFPASDAGLRRAASEEADGEPLTASRLATRAAHWSPWRSYAALLLWQAAA